MASRFFDLTPPDEQKPEDVGAASMPAIPEPAPAPPNAERRLALLIGNARYRRARLKNPINDVRWLGWALGNLGFAATIVEDATLAEMTTAIIAFGERLDEAGPQTVCFFYFAGHGIQHDGTNYLVPVDAELPSLRYLDARTLAVDAIVAQLGRTVRRANVVILDACRNNPFTVLEPTLRGITEGLTGRQLPKPTQLVYSTAASDAAEDGWGGNSPFAQALVEELPSLLTPGRRIQDVFDDVAARVSLWTEDRQTVAVYREGVLPPLTLTPADEDRLTKWRKRPWRLTRKHVAAGIAALAGAGIAALISLWFAAYPETRTTWLLRAGLIDAGPYDFTCTPPWDAATDRYGLTRRDWCLTPNLAGLAAAAATDAPVAAELRAGFAAGDPKAVTLMALRAYVRLQANPRGASDEDLREAVDLAGRAAATDLPLGHLLPIAVAGAGNLKLSSKIDVRSFADDLAFAAGKGVLIANLAYALLSENFATDKSKRIEAIFEQAASIDPTGQSAGAAADFYAGRLDLDTFNADEVINNPERHRYWLKRAALQGFWVAADEFLWNWEQGANGDEPQETIDKLFAVMAASDNPRGLYWRARQRLDQGEPTDTPEILALLAKAADAGVDAAALELAALDLDGTDGRDGPDPRAGIHWLTLAADRGNVEAALRLGDMLGSGYADEHGRYIVPPDAPEAKRRLETVVAHGDLRATNKLAFLLRYGPPSVRDLDRAYTLFHIVVAGVPLKQDAFAAEDAAAMMDLAALLEQAGDPATDIVVGAPDAFVSIVVYLSPSCKRCEDFVRDVVPRLTSDYVARGLARITLRLQPFGEPGQASVLDAALLAGCAAPSDRPALLTRLMDRSADWAGVGSPAERARLLAARVGGIRLAKASVAACLDNDEQREHVLQLRAWADGWLRSKTAPVIFVGGAGIDPPLPDAIYRAIRVQLPRDLYPDLPPPSR